MEILPGRQDLLRSFTNHINFMISNVSRRLSSFALVTIWFASSLQVFADSPIGVYSPTGVYRGEWRSGSTGHRGPMRAVVQPRADGNYQARFTGRFALVIPFAYKATLQPTQDEYGNTFLSVEKPLGPILGSYRMTAQANEHGFSGNFQAAGDNGSIQMKRIR